MSKPFAINRHGRMVFPSNFDPELDFSCIQDTDQLEDVVRRDFEAKAPSDTDIRMRIEGGGYASRAELLRDLALNLFWANRFTLTMYEKRPMRWCDVPRRRDDLFLPGFAHSADRETTVASVARGYEGLPATWDEAAEQRIFDLLFGVYRHKLHQADELSAIKPTVQEGLANPDLLTYRLTRYDPDFPIFTERDIIDCHEEQAELEALMRMAMVQHNQYPWDRDAMEPRPLTQMEDDDLVVMLAPRNRAVREFIRRVRSGTGQPPALRRFSPAITPAEPARPATPVTVDQQFEVQARLRSLAVYKGEHICRNDDVVRNAAYSWSPMSAEEITEKTGIEQRHYTELSLEDMALRASGAALDAAELGADEVGAVLFASCSNTRHVPSVAAWLSGELGMFQTSGSFDIVAACAGFPYGVAEATRMLQHVDAPILLVCAEKFSDKIGSVRPSRMIFGDGAAAMVIAAAAEGVPGDVECFQQYAGGPVSEVNSIILPNADFDNGLTVWAPEVRALAKRYLGQMTNELGALAGPDGHSSLLDAIDLVVPHQANRTMVADLAAQAGLDEDDLYFNIDRVGNISAASIPIAIHDAVQDGVIDRRMRVFAPGFGAGAVAGYVVMHVDPDIVVTSREPALAGAAANGADHLN